jgi:hypothetical protein
VGEPPVLFVEDILQNEASKSCQKWPQNGDGKPRNGFLQIHQ